MTGTRAVITALLLALGLAGCSGDDPEPRVAPPSPSAPSTTGTSGETAPEMPEAAKGTDGAAAEAFVEFYWETVNYAQRTEDVDPLVALADRCINCDNGVKSIRDTYRNGGSIRGGNRKIARLQTSFLNRPNADWAVVEYQLVTTEQQIDFPGETSDDSFPGGTTDLRMILEPSTDAWLVRSMVTR